MALPPAPGVTRAVFNYTSQGIATANVLHFTQPPGSTAPDPTALASDLKGFWVAAIAPLVHQTHILQNVTCTDLGPTGPPQAIHTTGLPSPGLQTGDPMPNNVALVMSLKTALRGRSYRGRLYEGGIAESNALGNEAVSAYRDALVSAWSQLIVYTGGPLTPDLTWVILSYFNAGSQRSSPVATPVTTLTANTHFDTMRRRMQ